MNGELTQVLGAGVSGVLLVVVVLAIFMLLRSSIRAVKEYDRLVIFFIGRFSTVRGPGLDICHPLC